MTRAIRLEFRKMRRLRTIPVVAALVIAVALLSSVWQFSSSTQNTFDDPSEVPWASFLLTYTLMAAMTSPLLTAVIASRQTDIEHSGAGWTLAATAGYTPGALCRAKLAALALILLPATAVQTLLVIGAGLVAGMHVPTDIGPWLGYTVWLYLINTAFCALHIWLAAQVENQLVSVGLGMLGAFLAVFSLFMPPAVTRLIPWGYYAVITHITQDGDGFAYTTPQYAWPLAFLVVATAAFALGTRRLNSIER
ncbi:ABC transporter permease [Plantactinospora sp. CA-290183]|uniref:ABC transporter permease n=1 Tax=Plantactinospora sp. CA-290183 TaxID=3240006 RepID=UPI003D8A336E